ncbi:MAG TPA: response regulator [Verrucomicrobiae bacterium]|jgi:DNA-binding response OmpR family regulator|nr:response regulator [Verrucomicrobiae bacterium]
MKSVTTILFVENDAVALTLYQKRLQREGFHVEVAEDGIAALRVLSEMTPDVVILDLVLPKFSGRDVFDYMRADPQFKDVPIIIFSNAPKSDWPTNVEASPTRALPKSDANFSALLELIRDMISTATSSSNPVAEPEPEPVLQMADSASTTTSVEEPPAEITTPQTNGEFIEYAIADMPVLREHCLAFIKSPSTETGRSNLSTLRQRLQVLNTGAQKSGCARLSLLAGAWEALLADIERKPAGTSPSILQTLAQAADCLRILLNNNGANSTLPLPQARVLSVDDDEICNEVAVTALKRANMAADSVQDANAALELLKQNNYDLILLDINMPTFTGFEVCEKLRVLPQHAKTPVIFVTAFNNFENRKQSVLSGGGDLIAKPVSPVELALKVTIHLLKAPPKTISAPVIEIQPEPALVWKEPEAFLSHDTEVFLKGVKDLNAAPSLLASTTETRTTDPENPAPEEVLAPVALVAAGPIADLATEAAEPPATESRAFESKTVELTTAESTIVESKTLESVAEPTPLSDEGVVVSTPRNSEPALPASNGSSQEKKTMSKENNNPQFDTLVLDVAHIIFGDNAPEINVRLVRMALEQVWANRANLQSLDAIAKEIARIIFGDGATSDLNVRLVRMALERSNSIALFKAA